MANMDQIERQIVELCRQAIIDIIASVGGVDNLLDDERRMALVNAIAARMQQLGADISAILPAELAKAYYQGITDADAFLHQEGTEVTVQGVNKQIHLAGIESIVSDTMMDMQAAIRTAVAMAIADIDRILVDVRNDIAKGMILGDPSREITKRVMQTFANSGMTAFITKDNKRLPLDFYAMTVTRTKMRQAHTDGAVNRYKENGVYHVKISEHGITCNKCARYQGLVVALDPEHAEGFPVAGIDVPLPPYHPNCRHTVRPFVMEYHSQNDIRNEKRKWKSFDPEGDPRTDAQKRLYKAEQDIRRKARQEMKEYMLMKATLPPDQVPKTLAAYRRMKRKNDAQWQKLQAQFKQALGEVDLQGPPPGTPRKRKGAKTGPGSSTPKTDKTDKKQNVSTLSTLPKGPKLTEADLAAHKEFDKRIDGIEFADRRQTARFLLDQIPGGNQIKVSIRKIEANGHVGKFSVVGGKFIIGEYALLKDDPRPPQYRWKTVFHEYYHAQMHGMDYDDHFQRDNQEWTIWEETATECAAFFMAQRAGWNVSTILPSYSEYLIRTLPMLKQLPEYADCETMVDFGAKFMKYRFNEEHKTMEWRWLVRRVEQNADVFDINEYFREHYLEHIKANKDRYADMIYDSLSQSNKFTHESVIRQMIKEGLESGIRFGTVNREIRLCLPVAMNELGVKKP
ncbi:minor capsid protein [Geobacillus phage TP-84]|uniref:Minor capsid protein n=1 Tax=Geobacillus phage TP-84 TaxID=1965361 RepID=A0A1U9WQQ0_9CAUD|nr:minor head protein [Geobacillus phage TP-84]AQY55106.1 minor capsid protein [Geobacillus phage TP-84]